VFAQLTKGAHFVSTPARSSREQRVLQGAHHQQCAAIWLSVQSLQCLHV
jgi:hypothetical protein